MAVIKTSKATEGGKGSLTFMSQSQAIIAGSQSRHLNRSRGRKDGGKLLSVFLWLVEQHVLYKPGPVAQEALPRVGWALFHQPFINQEKCPHRLAYRSIWWRQSFIYGPLSLHDASFRKLTN